MCYHLLVISIVTIVLNGCASSVQTVSFASAAAGSPEKVIAYEYKPEGEGPFPAVVVMHAGGGMYDFRGNIYKSQLDWARRLRNWGYVVFMVDTYGAREYSNVNQIGNIREAADQLSDAYGAFNYLSDLPYVDADRIGILGWSRGGLTVINVMEEPEHFQRIMHLSLQKRGLFRAGVAMYPVCRNHFETTLKGPLLILIGERDTAIWDCERIAENTSPDGHPAYIKIYPGARHSFDNPRGYNAKATKDARNQVNQFFEKYLGN
jgi:dienelactone hydrolase